MLGQKHVRDVSLLSEHVLKSLLSNERTVCVSVVDMHRYVVDIHTGFQDSNRRHLILTSQKRLIAVDDETQEQEEFCWREGITVTLKNDKEFILKISNADYYVRVVSGDASGAEEWVDAIEELVSESPAAVVCKDGV